MSIANPCFGRCTLAQATTAIGISSVIHSMVLAMAGFLALQHEHKPEANDTNATPTDNAILTLPVPNNYRLASTFLCNAMITLIVTFFLFIGVKTRNPHFLLPWLVIHGISAVMTIPRIIYQMTFSDTSLMFLIIRLLFSTLMVYMFIVVSIYFISLRALKSGQVVEENTENGSVIQHQRTAIPPHRRSSTSYVHLPPKNYVHNPAPRYEASLSPPPPYEHVV